MTKPLHAGNAARNGILAASLAQGGFTSQPDAFERPMGFLHSFVEEGFPRTLADLDQQLGQPYDLVEPGTDIKLYPSCNLTHPAIDAMLYLREEHHSVQSGEIEHIYCRFPQPPQHEILIIDRLPRTPTECRFSPAFLLAVAALEGDVWLHHFDPTVLNDSRVTQLMSKVRIEIDPSLRSGERSYRFSVEPTEIVIELTSGERLRKKVNLPKGSAAEPLSYAEIQAKYRKLASQVIPQPQVDRSLELLTRLTDLPTIEELMQELSLRRMSTEKPSNDTSKHKNMS